MDKLEQIKLKLKTVPELPGCYIMKDINGVIIYVGKAKNLKRRVSSYFRGAHDYKTTKMVSLVEDFEYIITSSELEAFILENNLIKKHDPKYNIRQTDDKTYPYICLTNETHPRLIYTRNINKRLGKYYGPYPNGGACKEVVERLNKTIPLRKCNKIPKKECLYYHLGQCLGPCINNITSEDYDSYLVHLDNILKGNVKDEIKYFTSLMNKASEEENYEQAIEYRNLISDLTVVSEKQNMEGYLKEADIFAYFSNDDYVSCQVFHLRDGKILARNGYLFNNDGSPEEIFNDFVIDFYLKDNNPFPKNIYVGECDIELISNALNYKVINPKKGKYKELLNLVKENAENKVKELLLKQDIEYKKSSGAIHELEELLEVKELTVIEAFDNSNILGQDSVSAMVTYVNGIKAPKLYRRFKVKTVVGANDVATMHEVVLRRYSKIDKMPDLIIMDGGKAQVDSALLALGEIGKTTNVLGLVKDENHKTRALFYDGKEILIDKNSYAFKLLFDIQEEVHRFAISYFHNVHTKSMIFSKLDEIEGIGKVKKNQILNLVGKDNFIESLKAIHLNDEQIKKVLEVFRR